TPKFNRMLVDIKERLPIYLNEYLISWVNRRTADDGRASRYVFLRMRPAVRLVAAGHDFNQHAKPVMSENGHSAHPPTAGRQTEKRTPRARSRCRVLRVANEASAPTRRGFEAESSPREADRDMAVSASKRSRSASQAPCQASITSR